MDRCRLVTWPPMARGRALGRGTRHRHREVGLLTLAGMAFRVLILGESGFRDYTRLRDALDAALSKRLPDVAILTAGGPGVPALAASYARSCGLELVALGPTTSGIRVAPANAGTIYSWPGRTPWWWRVSRTTPERG